ncbi:MAG: S-layer homology domain-containing protein [Lachnospiraceae bacterium]|nr:S-layer homology domain-containing protein [Lachnospiraceae bacterium]
MKLRNTTAKKVISFLLAASMAVTMVPSSAFAAENGTEAIGTEALEAELVEAEAVETEAVEAELVETEALETEAVETEAVETEAVEADAIETEAVETEASVTEAPETEEPVPELVVPEDTAAQPEAVIPADTQDTANAWDDAEELVPYQDTVAHITTAGQNVYFKYTVPEGMGGTYWFYSTSDMDTYGYLYLLVDGSLSNVTSNDDGGEGTNFRIDYELTEGNTYYYMVRFYSSDNTGDIPVKFYAVPSSVVSISAVLPDTVFVADINDFQIGTDAKVTLAYNTGFSLDHYVSHSSEDNDGFGNYISYEVYYTDDSGEEVTESGKSITHLGAGTVGIRFFVDSDQDSEWDEGEVCTDRYEVTVQSDPAMLPELSAEETSFTHRATGWYFYSFTPDTDGTYALKVSGYSGLSADLVNYYYDDGRYYMTVYSDNRGNYALTGGVTYYFRLYLSNSNQNEVNAAISIQEVPEITGLSLTLAQTDYVEGFSGYVFDGSVLNVTYSNGTSEEIKGFRDGNTGTYNDTFYMKILTEEGYEYGTADDSLDEGSYQVVVITDYDGDGEWVYDEESGRNIPDPDDPVSNAVGIRVVKPADEDFIPEVSENSRTDVFPYGVGSFMRYYSFTPEESGKYLFAYTTDLSVSLYDIFSCDADGNHTSVNYDYYGTDENGEATVSAFLSAGVKYYFQFQLTFETEDSDGAFTIREEEMLSVSGIAAVPSKTSFVEKLEAYYIGSYGDLTVTFNDGGTQDYISYSSSYYYVSRNDEGFRIRYTVTDEEGVNYGISTSLDPGTYTIIWYWDADEDGNFDDGEIQSDPVTVEVVAIADAEFPELTIGSNDFYNTSETAKHYFYTFTPDELGRYHFSCSTNSGSDGYFYVYSVVYFDEDGNRTAVGGSPYKLTPGTTYYVDVYGYDGASEGTITVVEKPFIDGITITAPQQQKIAGVNSSYIAAGTVVTVSYSDGSEVVKTCGRYDNVYTDDYNDYIYARVKDADGNTCSSYNSLSEGTYYISFYCYASATEAGAEIESDPVEVTVIPITEADFPELVPGETVTASIGSGGYVQYYTFTVPEDGAGRYVIESLATTYSTPLVTLYVLDESGNLSEIDSDSYSGQTYNNFRLTSELEAGNKYFYAVRWNNSSQTGDIPVSFTRIPNVQSLTVTPPEGVKYVQYVNDDYIGRGAVAAVTYDDGTVLEAAFMRSDQSSYAATSLGDRISYYITDPDGNRLYPYETVPVGENTVTFFFDADNDGVFDEETETVTAAPYTITMLAIEDADYPELYADVNNYAYFTKEECEETFTFTPESSGRYKFEVSNNNFGAGLHSPFYITEDGEQQYFSGNGWTYDLEAGRTYYYTFVADFYEDDVESGSMIIRITPVPYVSSLSAAAPESDIVYGINNSYTTRLSSLTIAYSDGTSETVHPNDYYAYGEYGDYFSVHIYTMSEGKVVGTYYYYSTLPEGDYRVVFIYDTNNDGSADNDQDGLPDTEGDLYAYYDFTVKPVEEASFPALSIGSNPKTFSVSDAVYYFTFTPEVTGRYSISGSYYGDNYEINRNNFFSVSSSGGKQYVYPNNGSYNLIAGTVYYLPYSFYSGDISAVSYDIQIEKLPDVTSISVVPSRTEFLAVHDSDYVGSGAAVTITYDNGDQYTASCETAYASGMHSDYIYYRAVNTNTSDVTVYGPDDVLEAGTYNVTFYWTSSDGSEITSQPYTITVLSADGYDFGELQEGENEISANEGAIEGRIDVTAALKPVSITVTPQYTALNTSQETSYIGRYSSLQVVYEGEEAGSYYSMNYSSGTGRYGEVYRFFVTDSEGSLLNNNASLGAGTYNVTVYQDLDNSGTYEEGELCAEPYQVIITDYEPVNPDNVQEIVPDTVYTAEITAAGSYAYYKYTVPEGAEGTYFFYSSYKDGVYYDTYGYVYSYRDGSGLIQLASDDDSGEGNNFSVSYYLEAGNTYYFGARMYSSGNTGSFNVTLIKAKEIVSVSAAPAATSFTAYIDSRYTGQGTVLTVTYEDGSQEEITAGASSARTSYGNYFYYTIVDKDDESRTYPYSEYLAPGTYKVVFYNNASNGSGYSSAVIKAEAYEITVLSPEEAGLEELELGDNTMSFTGTSGATLIRGYTFTPEEDGSYRFRGQNNVNGYNYVYSIMYLDSDDNAVSVSGSPYELKAGTTYYVIVNCDLYSSYASLTLNITKISKAVKLEAVPGTTTFVEYINSNYLGSGATVKIYYEDGTTYEAICGSTGVYGQYGEYISYRMDNPDAPYSETRIFTFVPETDGRYSFSSLCTEPFAMISIGRVYTITESGSKEVYYSSNGYYDLKAGTTYYVKANVSTVSSVYPNGRYYPAGIYNVVFYYDGSEALVEAEPISVEVIALADMSYQELHLGDNDVRFTVAESYCTFTPEESGRYLFTFTSSDSGSSWGTGSVFSISDSGERSYVYWSNGKLSFEAGTTYYIPFRGYDTGDVELTVNIQLVPDLVSIEASLSKTSFASGTLGYEIGEGAQVTFTYSNGETDTVTAEKYGFQGGYGAGSIPALTADVSAGTADDTYYYYETMAVSKYNDYAYYYIESGDTRYSHMSVLPDGSYEITFYCDTERDGLDEEDQYSGPFTVTVSSDAGVLAQQIVLSDAEVVAGKTLTMSATVLPENAEDKTVVWSLENYHDDTYNIDRATINSKTGLLTAKSAGNVTVVARTSDGRIAAKCNVKILFQDMTNKSSPFYKAIYWAVDEGITYGVQDKSGYFLIFGQERTCTRAQMVTFLWRLAGEPEPTGNSDITFTDVTEKDANKYYYKPVLWAAEEGITVGTKQKDGTYLFKPQDPCLRRQAVMFLWRLAGEPKETITVDPFDDVPEYVNGKKNVWYDPIMWAAQHNITTGVIGAGTRTFNEGGLCLRRQIVTFLYRYANPDWNKE